MRKKGIQMYRQNLRTDKAHHTNWTSVGMIHLIKWVWLKYVLIICLWLICECVGCLMACDLPEPACLSVSQWPSDWLVHVTHMRLRLYWGDRMCLMLRSKTSRSDKSTVCINMALTPRLTVNSLKLDSTCCYSNWTNLSHHKYKANICINMWSLGILTPQLEWVAGRRPRRTGSGEWSVLSLGAWPHTLLSR